MFEKTLYRSDMLRCALCLDAPCTRACGRLDCAGLLRSVWFGNEKMAELFEASLDEYKRRLYRK